MTDTSPEQPINAEMLKTISELHRILFKGKTLSQIDAEITVKYDNPIYLVTLKQ